MPSKLTRRGARELTVAIDKIADTVQQNADILGIDPKIATDFAYRSDLISDAVESKEIGLLVMGAYGHSRIRSLIIGSTTAEMIRLCKIPVVLFR